MKKNKVLFFIFAFALLVSVMGCTTRQMRLNRTQTRLGVERPNNMARRQNLVSPNVSPNVTGRDTIVNPNNRTNIVGRDTTPAPNLRTDITGRNTADINLINRSNAIARKVTDLNDVDRCSVLITGDTALVGVDIKNNIKGNLTTELKRRIETRVKNTDSRINNVAVTADPDLYTRIRNMAFDIENGRPISGFANEIKEMLRRITPIK